MKIRIAAPDIHVRDAVGNHCLAIALELTEQGYNCELFAQRYTSPAQSVRPLSDLLSGEVNHNGNDILPVSYSIYDRQLRNLLKLPGKKIVYFHGITPPELLLEHDPTAAYYCARGYNQISLLDQFDHIITNSSLNLRELKTRISRKLEDTRFSIVPPISSRFHIFSELTQSQDSFNNYMIMYHNNLGIKFGCVGLILIFQYHIFSGVRHIIMDFHILNESLSSSYKSAVTTLVLYTVNALLTLWVML